MFDNKSYNKKPLISIFTICTANIDITTNAPICIFSFLSSSSIGLNIRIIAIIIKDIIKKLSPSPNPKPTIVPTNVAISIKLAGILLLQAAAKIASPNGANFELKLTVDIKKDNIYIYSENQINYPY